MTATNHALTGAVVASIIKQPVLAIPLAFVSHFVCDSIPHFDSEKDKKLAKWAIPLDLSIAFVLVLYLTFLVDIGIPGWLVFLSMAAATSPDIVWGWRYFKLRDLQKMVEKPMLITTYYHLKIQWSETKKGIVVEALWFIAMSTILYYKAH